MEIYSDITESLFPVEKRVIYWAEEIDDLVYGLPKQHSNKEDDIVYSDLNRRIVNLEDSPYSGALYKCPRHYALVRLDNGNVFQCVTKEYKLITNKDALDIANIVANKVFKLDHWSEFSGYTVQGTHSGSQTVYNFWHDRFLVSYREDRWVPFLRIANSYNSTVALHYDLGFLIVDKYENTIAIVFDSMSMEMKDTHAASIEKIMDKLGHIISKKKLDNLDFLTKEFKKKMDDLSYLTVKRKDIFPLYLKMRGAEFDPAKASSTTLNQYSKAMERFNEITDRFFEESDAYYFMKVLAYYVNNPFMDNDEDTQNQNILTMLQSQKEVGKLIDNLLNEICHNHKKLTDFIGNDNYERAEAVASWRKGK